MKTNRIISFTLINASILLGFASILAGCQKKLYPSHGHMSQSHKLERSRSIASVGEKKQRPVSGAQRFLSYQDPAQIYIYCTLNSKAADSCYSKQLKDSVSKYEEKFGKLDREELNSLLDELEWSMVKNETQTKVDQILEQLEPQINKTVNQQHAFCKNNSKHFFKRCMSQAVEKDTFQVLNNYHKKHKMNGQEYLFLRDAINSQLNKKVSNLEVI